MSDEFFIVHDDCGIKTFPRAGSTTILHTYGYGQSFERWKAAPRRFVVVRNPWDRLISAYALFQNRRYTDIPKLTELNQLLDYILEREDKDRDVHVRSQWGQLNDYIPHSSEIVEFKFFLANPPMKIDMRRRQLWKNQTMRTPEIEFDDDKYKAWKRSYIRDFQMFDAAKKAPTNRGEA